MLTSARLFFEHVRFDVKMESIINEISTYVKLLHKRLKKQKRRMFATCSRQDAN